MSKTLILVPYYIQRIPMRVLQLFILAAVFATSVSFSTTQESSPELTTLYSNGSYTSLALGEKAVLYGTGEGGSVFKLIPSASPGGAWTETVLHTFTGQDGDGFAPAGSPALGRSGTLYGITVEGGQTDLGTVYNLIPPASPGGAWTETVLYSFAGGSDGSYPGAGVVIGKAGALYGTTGAGGGGAGCFPYGCGTVFTLAPPASPGLAWMETVLYSFTGGSDGSVPSASLVIGTKGELYGTTEYGGASADGVVFELTPPSSPGGAWTETVLHAFTGQSGDGAFPTAGLVIGKKGVLYGTTSAGGTASNGTVFELSPADPGAPWTETVLYSFGGGGQGGDPLGGVVIGQNGVLYGTTLNFGASQLCPGYDCGTVFALQPPASAGDAWTQIVLHNFTGRSDGAGPWAGVVVGESGALFGATSVGGSSNSGTVFKLTP
jgi:uncharacterized repeat protein (TIGR03803 family)